MPAKTGGGALSGASCAASFRNLHANQLHHAQKREKEVILSTYREGGTLTDQYKNLFVPSGTMKATSHPKRSERHARKSAIIEKYELFVAAGGTNEEFVKNELSEAELEDIAENGVMEDAVGAPAEVAEATAQSARVGCDDEGIIVQDAEAVAPSSEGSLQSARLASKSFLSEHNKQLLLASSVGVESSGGGPPVDSPTASTLAAPSEQRVAAAVVSPPAGRSSRPSSASGSRPSSARSLRHLLAGIPEMILKAKAQYAVKKKLLAQSSSKGVVSYSAIPDIPDELIADIAEGRCIAFVGAGFSAAAGLPDWRKLLVSLCEVLPSDFRDPTTGETRDLRRDLLLQGGYDARTPDEIASNVPAVKFESGLSPDMFASLLKNTYDYLAVNMPDERRTDYDFGRAVHRCLQLPRTLPSNMSERLNVLRSIPFRGIITTNFDSLLLGRTPFDDDIKEAYMHLLRPKGGVFTFTEPFGGEPDAPLQHRPGKPIIQLHGRVGPDWMRPRSLSGTSQSPSPVGGLPFSPFPPSSSPASRPSVRPRSGASRPSNGYVFSKAEYNAHIHGNPVNSLFLRSVFSTCTVLFLGFSFTDNYVDDLLDATMHLFSNDEDTNSAALSYAISPDKTGPVGRSSVDIVKAARGVQFLLYEHDPAHTNFLKTLEVIRDRVRKKVGETRRLEASVTSAATIFSRLVRKE
jgi:hypothetical protein